MERASGPWTQHTSRIDSSAIYMYIHIMRLLLPVLILAGSLALPAQSINPGRGTSVLAILTVREGVQREAIMKVMQAEIRATVQLYLDGRIQQWYSKTDWRGVVFVLDSKSVEEAKGVLERLPLIQENLASFEYIGLAPLGPLRLLMNPAPQAAK